MDYSTAKSGLDEIAQRIQQDRKRVQQAQASVAAAAADLAAMSPAYSAFVAEIQSDADAAPADEILAHAAAEKDKLVSEFTALRTLVDTINAELGAYSV